MTAEILQKIYSYVKSTVPEYIQNEAYVKGKNPGIVKDPKKGDPDNRIAIPLAKVTVEDMAGYAGRAQDRQIVYEAIEGNDGDSEEYAKIIHEWGVKNNEEIDTSEIYFEALSQGKAYQLWWVSDSDMPGLPLMPEYKMVSGRDVFIKYTDEVKPQKEYAVRFWTDKDAFDGEEDPATYAMVYYPYYAEGYRIDGTVSRVPEMDMQYPYSVVPMLEYKINKDGVPLFDAEKGIIDAIDKIVSKSINEVDRYNALILLLPFLADAGFRQKLVDMKVIDNLSQDGENSILPQFLEKNLAGVTEFYKWALDTMDAYYHKSTKIPDFSNPEFGAADDSGESKKMKMLGLEYRAATVDTYFNAAVMERKQLYDDVINVGSTGIDTESMKISIKCKRNLPVNVREALEIATLSKAAGISKETIFRNLPSEIIGDWKKELEETEDDTEPVPQTTPVAEDDRDMGSAAV